jgi:hypothetical protein
MNVPLAQPLNGHALEELDTRTPAERFAGFCLVRAERVAEGILSIAEATDELQAIAQLTGLVAAIGQDDVQATMTEAFATAETMADAFEREIMLRAADLVRQWERADPRDAWRHTGEASPPLAPTQVIRPAPYQTPQSTIDAFWYVVSNKDADGVADWLADHPRDETYLKKILERKCSTAAI